MVQTSVEARQGRIALRRTILAVLASSSITARFVGVRGTVESYAARHGLEISIEHSVLGALAGSAGYNVNEDVRPDFLKGKQSREHPWTFDDGLTVPASPSPSVVPRPFSNPASVDPEEASVAAIANCHVLAFLHFASRQGSQVDSYRDAAVGEMSKNDQGIPWVSVATLNPQIVYSGDRL
jgi:organic hydroperoxide reductase OsmC/OhrA